MDSSLDVLPTGLQECPICMEMKPDVEVLEHFEPEGDISDHKMCRACKSQCHRGCPFCRGITSPQAMVDFIADFLDMFSTKREVVTTNHDEQAEVFEQWQQFEMGWDGQPRALKLVAERILNSMRFREWVQQAIDNDEDWLTHMAGTIFRLNGMSQEGEVDIDKSVKRLLETAVDVIVHEYEERPPPNATYIAAVYQQALVAFVVAKGSGSGTRHLAETIRRVGKAIVRVYESCGSQGAWRDAVRADLHQEYIVASQLEVWGSQHEDVVWSAFYAPSVSARQVRSPQPHIGWASRNSTLLMMGCIPISIAVIACTLPSIYFTSLWH